MLGISLGLNHTFLSLPKENHMERWWKPTAWLNTFRSFEVFKVLKYSEVFQLFLYEVVADVMLLLKLP